ncbi:MAG TPA: hypothetical protein VFK44_01705 [Bacillales bacterium]|nr:hypothetical protein [Bacillales bacterium]
MQLFKFELYKIFKQKIIYVAFFLLILMSTGFTFYNASPLQQKIYDQWEGPLTAEKVEKANQANKKLIAHLEANENNPVVTESDEIKLGLYEEIAMAQKIKQRFQERQQKLEQKNNSLAEKESDMIDDIDFSHFSYYKGPMKDIDFVNFFAFGITAAMLLIGLAPIYSNEYSSGVDHYLLSSKKGRKALAWAKIGAVAVYTFLVVIAWELWNLFFNFLQYGNEGWHMPIQYDFDYFFSPYPLTMFEYHWVQFGIHLLGAFAFALLIVLTSSLCKNVLITFFINGFVFTVPLIMYEMIRVDWLRAVLTFSFIYVMKVWYLFDEFSTVNLFGYPMLYPVFAVIVMMGLSILFVSITLCVMSRKEVTS